MSQNTNKPRIEILAVPAAFGPLGSRQNDLVREGSLCREEERNLPLLGNTAGSPKF